MTISSAINQLAEQWGKEEAISELFHAIAEGIVGTEVASWTLVPDFHGRWLSEDEKNEIEDSAVADFWALIRDSCVGGPSDGSVKRLSFNTGAFDIIVRYGTVASIHHEVFGAMLRTSDVAKLLNPTQPAMNQKASRATTNGSGRPPISDRALRDYVNRLPIDTEVNREVVHQLAMNAFPDNTVSRERVRKIISSTFGRGRPGPKKPRNSQII
jgi:hypothetical protein